MDLEAYDWYIRAAHDLERLIGDTGETPISKEAEYEMKFARQRTEARVKAAFIDGQTELMGIRRMLEQDNKRAAGKP